ncbi:MAG: pyrimidine-nucleoside phosphorylase [Chloroflexota bacterium]|nr:pyrimidine-nucleoside phosphorylase [Chloroflexota bacterium]
MQATDVIAKKRDGLALTQEEIGFFIRGYVDGNIPDYQAAAWAMAVLLRGMTAEETAILTQVMIDSGETIDLSDVAPLAVDKHSTGGVGDKTTLAVAPMVAAAGVPVAKMSGRGLGFSGGTLDKLESIPNLRVSLTRDEFLTHVRENGLVIAGQTADLVPADGKLYALRDVTATVPSIALIASSIMSKKIAGGAQAIVLDVKVGAGAFMETLERARTLADRMLQIGNSLGRRVTAVLSNMDQPLGRAVGNALEVREAIDTLKGNGPQDFTEHCFAVGSEMLLLGDKANTPQEARTMLARTIEDGRALDRFRALIRAQGGDPQVIEDFSLLPQAPIKEEVPSPRGGFIKGLDAREVGLTAVDLGAGRHRKGEEIDHAVGIVLGPKVGDRVEEGEFLFTIHARNSKSLARARSRLLKAYTWSDNPVSPRPLIYETIRD